MTISRCVYRNSNSAALEKTDFACDNYIAERVTVP